MQDPSFGVPPYLLPHVHLISSYRYPTIATLNPDNAVEYLLQASKIVRDVQPVAWTYLQNPPENGTIFLVWQPSAQRQNKFSSDGYIWSDPEQTYTMESPRGFTVEVLVHRSGYRPGEQIATHSRQRYHIVSKNPSVQSGFPPDPSLWIVHYSVADPQYRFPVNRIPIHPDIQRAMNERRQLEAQGQLMRKEFMLHDRPNWPTINFTAGPPMQAGQVPPGGIYGANPLMNRQGQYYQQNQGQLVGQPPAKRPRQVPPTQLPGAPAVGMPPVGAAVPHDTSIEEDENTALGDLLDHLTPKDISTVRYTQHHEWMEEVFHSPYAAGQLMPVDLGFGLVGELAELTEGIFDAPNAQAIAQLQNPKANPKPYKKLDPAQLEEFESRVQKYVQNAEAELEQMKAEHAEKMAELRMSKTYMQAERRLRDAAFGHGHGDRSNEEQDQKVDAIVQEVEQTLKVQVGPRKDIVCVQKGGLIENVPEPVTSNGSQEGFSGNGTMNGGFDENSIDADNTAAGLLDQFTTNSLVSTPAANLQAPQASQPASQLPSAGATPNPITGDNLPSTSQAQEATSEAPDTMALTESMDLDIDIQTMPNDAGENKSAADDWVLVDQAGNEQGQASGTPQNAIPSATTATDISAMTAPQAEDNSEMFDTNFDDLTNFDTAGDDLADFTGGTLDNDFPSAFGEAFEGTGHHNDDEGGDL